MPRFRPIQMSARPMGSVLPAIELLRYAIYSLRESCGLLDRRLGRSIRVAGSKGRSQAVDNSSSSACVIGSR